MEGFAAAGGTPDWIPERFDEMLELAEEIDAVIDCAGTEIDAGPWLLRMLFDQSHVLETAIARHSG
jgi:hypothetical protein